MNVSSKLHHRWRNFWVRKLLLNMSRSMSRRNLQGVTLAQDTDARVDAKPIGEKRIWGCEIARLY